MVRKWVVKLVEMNRGQQVGLVMTVLGVLGTACWREKGVDTMQELASTILKQIGRFTI